MKSEAIAIYSAGGFGREVAWLLSSISESPLRTVAFIEDDLAKQGLTINGIDVRSFEWLLENHPGCAVVCAIGSPEVRRKVVERCRDSGFRFPVLQHSGVAVSEFVEVGEGSVFCAGSILTVNIRIGCQVHVNLDCTIGHDVVIGDYVTLSPGVHVSGNVHIEEGAYLGTGATIINGTSEAPLTIGAGTVVGASACVTKSTEPGSLYVGVPAVRKR